MVIIPPRRPIRRSHIILILILPGKRRVRRERITPIPLRDNSLRRPNSRDDGPTGVEKPHIRSVLIRHPERSVTVDDQALGIDRNTSRSGAVVQIVAKPVTTKCGGGQQGKAVVGEAARSGGVEARGGLAVWSGEEDRVYVGEVDVGRCWVGYRGIWLESEREVELVDAVDVVDGPLRVPGRLYQFLDPFISCSNIFLVCSLQA